MSIQAGVSRSIKIGEDDSATVEVARDRDYPARVDVHGPDGLRWVFGVTRDERAEAVAVYDGDQPVSREETPQWVREVLVHIGLEVRA